MLAGARPWTPPPLPPVPRSPVLGAVHEADKRLDEHRARQSTVEHEGNQPSRDFAWFRGDDGDAQAPQMPSGVGRNIRSRAAASTTVNVSDLGNGALFLQV